MYDWLYAFSDYIRLHEWTFGALAALILCAELVWAMIAYGQPQGQKMPEARKEQLKLRATMFNNLAVAMFTIGVVSPLVAAAYNLLQAPKYEQIVDFAGGWLATGIAFHLFGAFTLRGLR